MRKDGRKVNKKWSHINRLGECFIFGRVGSGKNSYIKTLEYLGEAGELTNDNFNRFKELKG